VVIIAPLWVFAILFFISFAIWLRTEPRRRASRAERKAELQLPLVGQHGSTQPIDSDKAKCVSGHTVKLGSNVCAHCGCPSEAGAEEPGSSGERGPERRAGW